MAAALHSAHILCGSFHPKNLLGVSQEKDDHVLVSFRGLIKRYNTHDRHQVRSWTTKSWHPFTCGAVYHHATDCVVAVVNHTTFTQWGLEDDDIDKAKRLSFEARIHKLLVSGDSVYMIFSSGRVEELTTALATRKETKSGFLSEGETIEYVEIIREANLVVMVAQRENGPLMLYRLQLAETVSQPQDSHSLTLNDSRLTGICATSSAKLITLWSTGEMYSFDFQHDYLEKLPGRHHAVEQAVVASKNTKILELSPSHVAIVGLDKGDEGGLVVLRDIKFAVVTSRHSLKMYYNPPLAWVTPCGLLVAEGSSLAVIPYTVQESSLATVFASKTSDTQGYPSEVCHSWVRKDSRQEVVPKAATETIYCSKSTEMNKVLQCVNRGALSESRLVAEVIAHLVEKKKLKLLHEAIVTFVDIPETCLVDVLNLFLCCENMEFEGLSQYPQMQTEFVPPEEDAEKIVCPFSPCKAHFINGVLRQPFTDVQMLMALPKISFNRALSLIQYLHFIIATGEAELCPLDDMLAPSLKQTALWLSLLLDTNYHQLVMSSEVAIHYLLVSCFSQVSSTIKFIEGMGDIELLARRIVKGQPLSKHTHTSEPYSLERLVIS